MFKTILKFVAVLVAVFFIMVLLASFVPSLQNDFWGYATFVVPLVAAIIVTRKTEKKQIPSKSTPSLSDLSPSQTEPVIFYPKKQDSTAQPTDASLNPAIVGSAKLPNTQVETELETAQSHVLTAAYTQDQVSTKCSNVSYAETKAEEILKRAERESHEIIDDANMTAQSVLDETKNLLEKSKSLYAQTLPASQKDSHVNDFALEPSSSETSAPPPSDCGADSNSVKQTEKDSVGNKPIRKTFTAKVIGIEYYVENIQNIAVENPAYDMTKKEIIDNFMTDERIYEYIFYPTKVKLVPEPDNPHDRNAVMVVIDGEHVGYIKAGSCARILKLLREDRIHSIDAEIGGGKYKIVYEDEDDDKYTLDLGKTNYFVHLTICEDVK